MAKITVIEKCRLCEKDDWEKVLPLAPTPVGDYYLPREKHPESLESYPLDVYQCRACGHVQLRAIVDPEYLYTEYIYTTSSSLGLSDHFARYAATVCERLGLKPGGLVVEIGSNDGTMLRAFKDRGMRVLGVDPAREIARRATESGIPTRNAFFTPELAAEIVAQEGEAALVIANNVMANVPDPEQVVRGVARLLGREGVFVFETGYLRYLAEDVVFDNIYHEHIDYYSIQPLAGFFSRLGLQLFDVDHTPSKGSSIRSYVQAAGAGRPVTARVTELVEREREKGYATAAPYRALGDKLDATKAELRRLLEGWKKEGLRIGAYGASVGVTTVLYHFELGGLIDFLIDDNPVRQGLFSPGLAIPVVGPQILAGPEKPDVVVILAWRYAEPILAKNQAYLRNSGRFLKILPEIELIGEGP